MLARVGATDAGNRSAPDGGADRFDVSAIVAGEPVQDWRHTSRFAVGIYFDADHEGPVHLLRVSFPQLVDDRHDLALNIVRRKRSLYDDARFADMPVKHEPAFPRVHWAIEPLNGMRNAVIEQCQPIEPWLDQVEQVGTGGSRIEGAAEQVALVHQHGFAAERSPVVPSERINVSQSSVGRIVMQPLHTARYIEA